MSYRTFRIIQALNGMVLGAIFGFFTASDNWMIPLIALPVSLLLMLFLRRRIKEVIVDERTKAIAGNASRLALSSGIIVMAIAGIIMYITGHDGSEGLRWSGLTLCYAACGLMVISALANIYYKGKYSGQE